MRGVLVAGNLYRFHTRWRVEATPEQVFDVLADTADLPRWWPAVWLKVEKLKGGDAEPDGVGSAYRMTSKGYLPYVLTWTSTSVEKARPRRLRLRASGDFEGEGCWTFAADGPYVNADYDWVVAAEKPLLKYFSRALRPLFAANHNWAMRRGEESLKLELRRRAAASEEERRRVPPPPGPVWLSRRRRRELGIA